MQQLMVLRHAKAVPWSPDSEDFPRKLSAAGLNHASNIANWMRSNLDAPQSILCSPAQRTRETLAPLLSAQPTLEDVTRFVPQIYHASIMTLESLLDAAFASVDRVLIVGHNPGFEQLVGKVLHLEFYGQFTHLPTGTLAVIDFEPDWASGIDRGRLHHLIYGKKPPAR